MGLSKQDLVGYRLYGPDDMDAVERVNVLRATVDSLLTAAGYPEWRGDPAEGPPDPDKWIANMRAQHAEMLAALKATTGTLEHIRDNPEVSVDDLLDGPETIARARVAIAKAEGR